MHRLKVVVFGRGCGECILVELENDEWMVVDSFISPVSREAVALTYLKEMGLDPKLVLKKIVITHFHQDHIRGMASLVKAAADDASIYMPQAFTSLEAVEYYATLDVLHGYEDTSGISELSEIVDYMNKAGRVIEHLKAGSALYNGDEYQIFALSPSEYDCSTSHKKFLSAATSVNIDENGDKLRPLNASKKSHNHYCVVLSIHSIKHQKSVILGSDLEVVDSELGGWNAAMNSVMAPKINSVETIKIPHHGSENGYHEPTWNEFVVDDVIGILTEFNKSKLPKPELIAVYKKHTSNLYSATRATSKLSKGLSDKALKIVKSKKQEKTIKNLYPPKSFGYVEVYHSNDHPVVELFYDAFKH